MTITLTIRRFYQDTTSRIPTAEKGRQVDHHLTLNSASTTYHSFLTQHVRAQHHRRFLSRPRGHRAQHRARHGRLVFTLTIATSCLIRQRTATLQRRTRFQTSTSIMPSQRRVTVTTYANIKQRVGRHFTSRFPHLHQTRHNRLMVRRRHHMKQRRVGRVFTGHDTRHLTNNRRPQRIHFNSFVRRPRRRTVRHSRFCPRFRRTLY